MFSLFTLLRALFVAVCLAPPAMAELAAPTGPVLLTVSGAISVENQPDAALFDLVTLESMTPRRFTTTTIWTEGEQSFTGVSLKDLLAAVGASGSHARAMAINDYAIDIPLSDLADDAPIIAYRNNGALMSVRDKGPLWIVYPYSSDAAYQTEQTYSRSIWQLDRIVLVD